MPVTRTSGQGRPKGVPNKHTAAIKAAFERAFALLQQDDQAKLEEWAKRNPTEFYKLAGKLIPSEINANVSGSLALSEIVQEARARSR